MVESYTLTNPTIISTKRVRRTLVDYLGLVGTLPPPGSMDCCDVALEIFTYCSKFGISSPLFIQQLL